MSSSSSVASEQALETNRGLAESYYNIALPALQGQLGSINSALQTGEPGFLREAYTGQRANLTEGFTGADAASRARMAMGSKAARSGGNLSSTFAPSDMGKQLANALYGSKFQEGQANIDQTMNLMNMAFGGANTAGNAALTASGQQLQAINYLPNYNPTLANISGGLAGAASVYGIGNQQGWWGSNLPAGYAGLGGVPGNSGLAPGGFGEA